MYFASSLYFALILLFFVGSVQLRPDFYYDSSSDNEPKASFVSVVSSDGTSNGLTIKKGTVKPYVALAVFKNTFNITGWSLLKVFTNGSYADDVQAEAAGMAEGYISADQISMTYQNTMYGYCAKDLAFCDKLETFLNQNTAWINQQIKENQGGSSYWHQVALIYKQLKGMQVGYSFSKTSPAMKFLDFRFLQIGGDLEDLEIALGKKVTKKVLGSDSGSALVKLFPNNADLAISHVTWNDFNTMLRTYKMYNFSYHMHDGGSKMVSGAVQSFSSYPGVLYSGDDFHILSSGLVSQETSIGNSNKDLWKYVNPETLLEWVRTIVANRLAKTGNEWCSLFERFNSGTYNNQWMILDYNRFEVGKPLKPDTLWILEQLPGTVHMADMTVVLQDQGYWASYNIPYFPFVYNISGVEDSKKKYGSWFDYNLNPRAEIFKRDHGDVTDMQTLVKLMRYNNFVYDTFSECTCMPPSSAENAISARSDLNEAEGEYPFTALGNRRHGGTDCKATNSIMAKRFSQIIVAGPTFDEQSPFRWSGSGWKKPLGHPDLFKFGPTLLDWSLEDWIEHPDVPK